MNLTQIIKKQEEAFEKAIAKNYRGQDPYWPDWEGIKSFLFSSQLSLLKAVVEMCEGKLTE